MTANAQETCSVQGCPMPIRRRRDGLCNLHRIRLDRLGTLHTWGRPEQEAFRAEISARVTSTEAFEPGECWEWPGPRKRDGYGTWGDLGMAHRLSFAIAFGVELDPTIHICHHCDNPPCFRPSHLFAGDALMNAEDAAAKRRFPLRTGERNSQAKVTDEQADEITRRRMLGESARALAVEFGINRSQIYRIAGGKRGQITYLGTRHMGVAS